MLEVEETFREQKDHKQLSLRPLRCSPNAVWREKVSQWCYDVADHLGESRSTVYVAMNILDRYCANQKEDMNEQRYEISSMAAVFLAVRISGSGNIRLQHLLEMSQGELTAQDIISTGTDMIKVLTWDHKVISPRDFVTAFLDLLPSTIGYETLLDSACYLVELAVCDVVLSRCKASDVALAAVMNALVAVQANEVDLFAETIKTSTSLNIQDLEGFRNRLHRLYTMSFDSRRQDGPHLIGDDEESPPVFLSSVAIRSVSDTDLCTTTTIDEANGKRLCPSDDQPTLKRARTGL